MIQRVQSILLLDVVIISILLLFFPFVSYENLLNTFTLKVVNQPFCGTWYYLAEALNAIILILALATIFLFKNRPLQMKLANLLALLSAALLAVLLFTDVVKVEAFLGGNKHVEWPSYLPIISMFSSFMAGVFIRKDEKLVRSADRIR
jgi:surface polysaccharide O-acyltransferase-like enzyme